VGGVGDSAAGVFAGTGGGEKIGILKTITTLVTPTNKIVSVVSNSNVRIAGDLNFNRSSSMVLFNLPILRQVVKMAN
jgi:hypothetical protein